MCARCGERRDEGRSYQIDAERSASSGQCVIVCAACGNSVEIGGDSKAAMNSHDDARKLLDEDLKQVSGGEDEPLIPNGELPPCPNCGTCDYETILSMWNDENYQHLYLDLFCRKCKGEWTARYV